MVWSQVWHSWANTIRPAQLLRPRLAHGWFLGVFHVLPDQVLVYGDCAVTDPDAESLADICCKVPSSPLILNSTQSCLISYSTGKSGKGVM